VVENMAYFTPDDSPEKKYYIFGQGGGKQLAEEQNIPYLGELPLQQSVREQADEGNIDILSPAFKPFETLAAEVARQVSIVNSQNLA
jgi:ATP-binding protein involved in chromosome partitioning